MTVLDDSSQTSNRGNQHCHYTRREAPPISHPLTERDVIAIHVSGLKSAGLEPRTL